jgi:trimeric autotransporter adhesin
MALFTGTNADDNFVGTVDNDTFDMAQNGKDTVQGGDGADTINFGSKFTKSDSVDGGAGIGDVLTLSGNYSAGLIMKAATMVNIEQLTLVDADSSYDITIVNANTAGDFLLSASQLDTGESVRFDAAADTDTNFDFLTGAGDDVLIGGAGNDGFVAGAGNDVQFGGAGIDNFNVFGFFGAGDAIDGGDDTDFLALEADYSAGLTITKDMLKNVEIVTLFADFDWDITFGNKVAAGGQFMSVDSSFVGAGHTIMIDASAESAGGRYLLRDTAGADTLLTGNGEDFLDIDAGGDDVADAGGGDDEIGAGAAFTRDDTVRGGNGHDVLQLEGDYSALVAFKGVTMTGIEELILGGSNAYNLRLNDDNVGAGDVLLVAADSIGANVFTFDGGNELDGAFDVTGGAGNDIITGSDWAHGDDILDGGTGGSDTLDGGRGDDQLFSGVVGDDTMTGGKGTDFIELGAGGHGSDHIIMHDVVESTGADRDTVAHFNTGTDRFDLDFFVSGFDASVAGALNEATFDADLEAALHGSTELGRLHATLFTPDSGDLGGKFFLVIDANNRAGYQAGDDFVVQLTDFVGGFSNAIFI